MHIGCYDLTPTYGDINNHMSVKYFLKIVLIDDEDNKYSKQQEIYLWRKHL
jgi:vacuolar protein sorting-associated protein 26